MSRDAYKIQLENPLDREIPRLFRSQVTHARRALKTADDTGVHTARKAIKRARAVLRLVRGGLPRDRNRLLDENLRNIGKRLAGVRDAAVAITLTEILAVESAVKPSISKSLAEHLNAERTMAWKTLLAGEGIEAIRHELSDIRIPRDEVAGLDALSLHDGISWTYARGRERLAYASERLNAAAFHAWRRQAKHLGYQLRLLTPAWPLVLRSTARAVDSLTEALGDEHDLSELIRLAKESTLGKNALASLQRQVRKRRKVLQRQAWPLGARIYAEAAGPFASRLTVYLAAALAEEHGVPIHPVDEVVVSAPSNRPLITTH